MLTRLWNRWRFGNARWRRRAKLTWARRLWWKHTHEACCHFEVSLFAHLAPRLGLYAESCRVSAPFCYPFGPEHSDQDERDFDAWERDVRRAAGIFSRAVERSGKLEYDEEFEQELQWAMDWLARWHRGIWV